MKKIFALLVLVYCCQSVVQAQDSKQDKKDAKTAAIRNIVDSQNYVFKAQSAMPLSGPVRQLSSEYDCKVTKATITCYLPYFGRAYSAPIGSTQGGIQFTSKDFEYKATARKKGGWDIRIKPKDYRDVQQIYINISENGYGTLQVTSTNRQSISFNGYIAPVKAPK